MNTRCTECNTLLETVTVTGGTAVTCPRCHLTPEVIGRVGPVSPRTRTTTVAEPEAVSER